MNSLKRSWARVLTAAVLPVLLGACGTTLQAPFPTEPVMPTAEARAQAEAAWADVLHRFVDDQGRVDFRGIAADPEALNRYVAFVWAVGPDTHPALFPDADSRLAHYINSYNALSMYTVIEKGIPEALDSLTKRAGFFVLTGITVGGEETNLYDYESDVIRALGEPRIHFALNCMAVSCPRLPQLPFSAERLDAELERETVRFFAEQRNLRVDPASRTVFLSEIVEDFFPEDFLAVAPSLIAYVNRYVDPDIPADFAVEGIPYDWTINAQPEAGS